MISGTAASYDPPNPRTRARNNNRWGDRRRGGRPVLLAELLTLPGLGLIPGVPGATPDRPVRSVYTTDLLEPGGYLDGGELVLTSATWYRGPLDAEIYVRALADAGCVALVAGTAGVGRLPAALGEACQRHGLAMFTVGDDVSFATIT